MHHLECAYSDKTKPFERHFHNAYELLYVVSGTVEISIGAQTYTVLPHSLVFISKLEEHNIHIVEGEYRRYYILIPPSQLPQLVSEPRPIFVMCSVCSILRRLKAPGHGC